MVGLTASELQVETLFPGDTIEYYSMAFVAGDPRGHRLSKVLRVDRKDDEFPISVDTQEILPLTIMLKRKRDRNDVEISSEDAKWRKLRTFRLVDGEVEGETRADRLNAELKKSLADAMKATKKQLAQEKAEKADAGSRKLMNQFFTTQAPAGDEGDTTSSQSSSFERHSTPEREPKRKPLTPRDNTDRYSSNRRSHDKVRLTKSYSDKKSPLKTRTEDKATRCERQPKYESSKHTSLKRKRSDSTSTRPRQIEAAPRKTQKSISKFFGDQERRRPKKKNGMLEKFVERIEEIEVKKQDADINEYLALDAKQQNEIKTVNSRMQAGDSDIRGSDRSDKAKSNWKQQRKDFSKANAKQSTTLSSWLTPLEGRRKDELEETSGGTPQKSRRRYLNLSPEKTNSPKMNRKNGISFVMPSSSSGDASHRTKEVGSSKDHALKREGLPLKKRGSLGTVSARAPKKQSLTSRWIGKKSHA
ncbi:hypothetical protein KRP22_001915 [Phytophthora ramorum]|uniref:uncharacterized protein n=1 Tax=Phytophthora ramorum TaxID=164328 RepID=UPI0030A54862|nr:hypothetical protein KRP23_1439 [Phytophthora ramorum]KAH7509702.1 hypothetical protein KRP22_1198 [Phytophthora ramorum]